MAYKKVKLGDYIEGYDEINKTGEFKNLDDLQGINSEKYFQGCKSNKNEIDLNRYRICRKGMFAYNKATSRNGEKISIAYRTDKDCLISPSYICFSIKDENIIMPEYLMLWFKRPEFDRYARFNSWGSATEFFTWEDFQEIEFELPTLEEQQMIVRQYKTITDRISLLEKEYLTWTDYIKNLYKRLYGNVPAFQDDIEGFEIPEGWRFVEFGELVESFSKTHSFNKKELIFLNTSDILNGDFLCDSYMEVSKMPGQAKKQISEGDILYSEIRPANKRFAFVDFNAEDYVVSTKLMVLRTTQKEISNYRIYHYLTMEETLVDLQRQAEGSSGTFPQITFDENLSKRKFLIADKKTELEFQKVLEKYYKFEMVARREIKQLSKLRDLIMTRI